MSGSLPPPSHDPFSSAPQPPTSVAESKPWWKTWWAISLGALLTFGAIGSLVDGTDTSGQDADPTPVMPEVTGMALDSALASIQDAGFDDDVDVNGGGVFGVVVESNWTVCAQFPAAGDTIDDPPELTVDRDCPEPDGAEAAIDAEATSSTTSTSTPTPTTTRAPTTTTRPSTTAATDRTVPTRVSTTVASIDDINATLAVLAALPVLPEPPRSGYSRDTWPHWNDVNGSGCDTRQDVLLAQVIGFPQVDPYSRGCVIVEGDWYSVWDGVMYAGSPSELDIDHIVSLAEAHDSGGANWSTDQKRRFANDPANLVAVTASSNRSKSDDDVGEWRPVRSAWCAAATVTVNVKAAYGLSVDARERDALEEMLGLCGEPGQVVIGAPLPESGPPPSNTVPASNTTIAPATTAAPNTTVAPPVTTAAPPVTSAPSGLDPRFDTCTAAKAAGYGPYVRGVDPEYDWYRDGDSDGTVCE